MASFRNLGDAKLDPAILVLNNGAMLAEGTTGEVRGNPAVIEAYLGTDAASA